MRDALLLAIVLGGSIAALRHPWVGMLFWTWVSVMNPHQQWGYATAGMPIGAVVALATLVGLVATRERRNPLDRPAHVMLLLFVIWTCITLPFSIYLDESLPLWQRSMKIWLMIFVTIALIDSKRKLDWFIWVCALSVGFYGIKGGVFTIATGGSFRVWGPGGFIAGNNEIAVAVIIAIPLLRYLQLQQSNKWVRRALLVSMVLCAVTAVGTYSRGALLAIIAIGAFLWLKSRNKFFGGILIVALGFVILFSMPQHWWARMDTIGTYQEDASAQGRLNAWFMAWNLASDRLFGGGFMVSNPGTFMRYAPDPNLVLAAHSIYFQILGEHGFIGLALFLAIGALTWREATGLISLARNQPALSWAADLGRMIHVSMVGFGVGGAFLSLAYFDLPYNITAMAGCAAYIVQKQVRAQALGSAGGSVVGERSPGRAAPHTEALRGR